MNKTDKYTYKDHSIIVNYNNHSAGNTSIKMEDLSVFVDGKQCQLQEDTRNGKFIFNCAGELASIDVDIAPGLYINKERIMSNDYENRRMNLNNLQRLAPHANFDRSRAEFLALKSLTPGAVTSQSGVPKCFLRVSDGVDFPIEQFDPSKTSYDGFIEIYPFDINRGDDVVIVESSPNTPPKATLIEGVVNIHNISYSENEPVSKFLVGDIDDPLLKNTSFYDCSSYYRSNGESDMAFTPHYFDSYTAIEGLNKTWVDFDVEKFREEYVDPMITSAGITQKDVAAIFTQTTYMDELMALQHIVNSGYEITDEILHDLENGVDAYDITSNLDWAEIDMADEEITYEEIARTDEEFAPKL